MKNICERCLGTGCGDQLLRGIWPDGEACVETFKCEQCDGFGTVENPPMPQSNKDRQEALRARRLMLGQTEVRGIYLHPELHAELKAYAKKLQKRQNKATNGIDGPSSSGI